MADEGNGGRWWRVKGTVETVAGEGNGGGCGR